MNGSFEAIDYRIRPAKQVERQLIATVLQRISPEPFDLRAYTYLGLGSIYYSDFVLFHNLFGFSKLICAEREAIPGRMEFNKPFSSVELVMKPVSEYIATMPANEPHLCWLDFDDDLNLDIVSDISTLASKIPSGSIIIATVKSHYRTSDNPEELFEKMSELLNPYLIDPLLMKDITGSGLQAKVVEAIEGIILNAILGSETLQYCPLFRFTYADNARMSTAGGLVASPQKCALTRQIMFGVEGYCNDTILDLQIPKLTGRERLFLDQHLPGAIDETVLPFEIKAAHIRHYEKYYRFLPKYALVVE